MIYVIPCNFQSLQSHLNTKVPRLDQLSHSPRLVEKLSVDKTGGV